MCVRSLPLLCLLVGSSLVLTGCGGGGPSDAPETVQVSGVVTYAGKPVPQLSVAFIPEKGLIAYGTTDDEGKFELMTNEPGDGAVVGEYKVAINYVPDEVPEMPGFPGAKKTDDSPIPKKYGDVATSKLTATVDPDSSKNKFTFTLTD